MKSKTTLALAPDRQASRMRLMIGALIQKAASEMGGTPFGMMLGPFVPMILPAVDKMDDEQALGILAFVDRQLHYVKTGTDL